MTTTHAPVRTVSDVMTTGVVSAHEQADLKEIVETIEQNRISAVPVLDAERHVVGVVTTADLLARISLDRGTVPRGHRLSAPREQFRKETGRRADEIMTAPAITAAPTDSIRTAATTMARTRVRCLPVVDDKGLLVGMVTKGDLLKSYLRADADIRREIQDGIVAELLMLEPFTVEVEVEEGIVTLSGFVSQPVVADQLRTAVRNVPGVIDVDDSLREPVAGERH